MALGFGRKKAAAEAQNDAPIAPNAPAVSTSASEENAADLDAFDLDAFAAQLQSGGVQTSPFDADLIASNSGSAFDFPETASSPSVGGAAEAQTPDFNQTFVAEEQSAIASGQVSPPLLSTRSVSPHESDEPLPLAKPRKKLPLVPMIGALVILGLAGGAATFFLSGPTEDAALPVAPAPQETPPQAASPTAVPQNVSAAPPVATARPPASDVQAQLKALWQQGADAKHRGDLDAARRLWQQGLQMQPDNRGFIESIAKLGQKSNR